MRADVLDKLVDQAGEVSIARSSSRTSQHDRTVVTELTENVSRLRSQLREVEIQAETQIQTQSATAVARHPRDFDPLEFDRYTRLQELTRMLAESVERRGHGPEQHGQGPAMADTDLSAQIASDADLQQQLMRVRLVPFATIGDRLYRVARQSAKELDKRVNLEIRGGSVEIDRGVLERMVAPFEHLLRNSIVHGLEPPAERAAAARPRPARSRIDVRQEGNEIILVVSDDGAGLNLPRIRAARHRAGPDRRRAAPSDES